MVKAIRTARLLEYLLELLEGKGVYVRPLEEYILDLAGERISQVIKDIF